MKTAGIIGGQDFLGCDITLKFLSENYRVKILVPEPFNFTKTLIRTGLKANNNLLFCYVDMHNQHQLKLFLEDCDCLIHCGMPYRLKTKSGEGPLYIPLISSTGNLLKSIKDVYGMGKIIFFASVSVYNQFQEGSVPGVIDKEKAASDIVNYTSEKAFYHSRKLIDNILNDFADNQIEIIVVAPVVVLNNSLINSRDAVLEGLRYVFRHKIEHDYIFQRLIKRMPVKTMFNVADLPQRVFDSVESYREYIQVRKLSEKADF